MKFKRRKRRVVTKLGNQLSNKLINQRKSVSKPVLCNTMIVITTLVERTFSTLLNVYLCSCSVFLDYLFHQPFV